MSEPVVAYDQIAAPITGNEIRALRAAVKANLQSKRGDFTRSVASMLGVPGMDKDDIPFYGLREGLASAPTLLGLVNPNLVPDWANRASEHYDRAARAQLREQGLRDTQSLSPTEKIAFAGGEMLSQLPAPSGALNRFTKMVPRVIKPLGVATEYFGPTIEPGLRNYAMGTGIGSGLRIATDTPEEPDPLLDKMIAEQKRREQERRTGGFAKGGLARATRALKEARPPKLEPLQIVKEPGGQWLGSDRTSTRDTLMRMLNRGISGRDPGSLAQEIKEGKHPDIPLGSPTHQRAIREEAANKWVTSTLRNYIERDLATQGDPVRALAERGISHWPDKEVQAETYTGPQEYTMGRRMAADQDPYGVAENPLAKTWEDVADQAVVVEPAWVYQGTPTTAKANPWIDKVAPDTPVSMFTPIFTHELGFSHLNDEMRNALDTRSDLPPELQLRPESLSRMSVPQMVEHVDKINKWRAESAAEANLAKANNPATVLHKDYPEQGMRWVQLKVPESGSEDVLREALKYEGDTMGHCVGAYCPGVVSGKSQIYSLRDAKGRPHVTIEVAPKVQPEGDMMHEIPEDVQDQLFEEAYDVATARGLQGQDAADFAQGEAFNRGRQWLLDRASKAETAAIPRIVQIKGKGNAKPVDKYIPFVQDFVKSGQWSDVGDLRHTNLVEWSPQRQHIPRGLTGVIPRLDETDIKPGYYTEPELADLIRDWQKRTGNTGFAKGGLARATRRLKDLDIKYAQPLNVIKDKGGQWLTGSAADAVEGTKATALKPATPEKRQQARSLADDPANSEESRAIARKYVADYAVDDWLRTALKKYIERDMATPGDSLRALAERGITYLPKDKAERFYNTFRYASPWIGEVRKEAGFQPQGEAINPLAVAWENAADYSIFRGKPDEVTRGMRDRNPWLEKVDPDTPVFFPSVSMNDIGLNVLGDRLRGAVHDPEGKIPEGMTIRPEALNRMSVPQVVEHLSNIEKRIDEEKMAKAAKNPSIVTHKEYPDGMRWVEIKKPDTSAEGRDLEEYKVAKESASTSLKDALKHEGDIMQHCVGGYCSAIEEGGTRIFSLRDAKGEPHTTIEVKQPTYAGTKNKQEYIEGEIARGLTPEHAQENGDRLEANGAWLPELQQIKGKQNRAPVEKYLPYVQDFVTSGNWSHISHDGHNAGLRGVHSIFNDAEREKIIEAGGKFPAHGWLTGSQIQELHNLIYPEGKRLRYDAYGNIIGDDASHRRIYDEDEVARIAEELRPMFADGGLVSKAGKVSRAAQKAAAEAAGATGIIERSNKIPFQYFDPKGEHNGQIDAMRHLLLQAQLTRKYGETPAKIVSFLHEHFPLSLGQSDAEQAMDIHNDQLGREVGLKARDDAELVELARKYVQSGKAKTLTDSEGGY